jgi:hypothetical protein
VLLRYGCAPAVSGHPDKRIPVVAELAERLYLILSTGEMLVVIESSWFLLWKALRIGGTPRKRKVHPCRCFCSLYHEDYFTCCTLQVLQKNRREVLRMVVPQVLSKDKTLHAWLETLQQQAGQETSESFTSPYSSFQLVLKNASKPLISIIVKHYYILNKT